MKNSVLPSFILISFVLLFSNMLTGQASSMPGYINVDNVNMRVDHTTQAKVITMLKKGQGIYIITSYRPEGNNDEAILRSKTDFYDTNYGFVLFSLPKGKAVKVNSYNGSQYDISFRNDMTGKTGFAKIDPNRLEFIGGETWYFVEVNNQRGWVFGKYVSYY